MKKRLFAAALALLLLTVPALADFNVNVLDISQTVMQGYFTMMMATEVSACNVPLGELVTRMDEIGKEMGLSIRVQREDIFEAMHRI